jgi:hypothetical protein
VHVQNVAALGMFLEMPSFGFNVVVVVVVVVINAAIVMKAHKQY